MARVVVGIDGSACAGEALSWAAKEAALRSATLEVLCAYRVPASWLGMGDGMGPLITTPVAVDDLKLHAERILDEALEQVRQDHPGLEATSEARLGPPAEVLENASKGADLLVVGSRGHGDLGSILLGSVGMHCVHHAACPVVVIRSGVS